MKKNKFKLIITIFFTCLSVILGLTLPHFFIRHNVQNDLSVIHDVPEEYYLASSTLMAKKASEQLGILDRLKLISGAWESTISECDTSEAALTELEAVSLAKEKIEQLYKLGVYPFSLASYYKNWYSWETALYKYTDNVFSTYTVYLWCIKYTKYDNSVTHTIFMTEDGTICLANSSQKEKARKKIGVAYSRLALGKTLGDSELVVTKKKTSQSSPQLSYPNLPLEDVIFTDKYIITIEGLKSSGNYEIFQYENGNNMGIGIWAE